MAWERKFEQISTICKGVGKKLDVTFCIDSQAFCWFSFYSFSVVRRAISMIFDLFWSWDIELLESEITLVFGKWSQFEKWVEVSISKWMSIELYSANALDWIGAVLSCDSLFALNPMISEIHLNFKLFVFCIRTWLLTTEIIERERAWWKPCHFMQNVTSTFFPKIVDMWQNFLSRVISLFLDGFPQELVIKIVS